ncbi:MAG: hypothetical protein LBP22_01365 [Deltaproteobacteria bacterium]|jgi:hypothetical protein|nr:hypothetical protein [Deltaproteobacteria bacterium]
MHKEAAAAELSYDESVHVVRKAGEVSCQEHAPLGVTVKDGQVDRTALNDRWLRTAQPLSNRIYSRN